MARRADQSGRVPVSWGSPRFFTKVVGPLEITDAFFPADAVLDHHTHDRTVVAVTLSGAIESRLPGRAVIGTRNEVWTEPAGEKHANRVGAAGARVLVIQPDPGHEPIVEACRSLLEGVHHFRNGEMAHLARCLIPELRSAEPGDDLMIEGLGLQILSAGARSVAPASGGSPCVTAALQLIHDSFRERLTAKSIAAEVGLHPAHFARVFKARTGVSVGHYVRRLRLDWAARQLRTNDEPIGLIAIRAGFADQSHFTREFRRHTGETPSRYRKAHSRSSPS